MGLTSESLTFNWRKLCLFVYLTRASDELSMIFNFNWASNQPFTVPRLRFLIANAVLAKLGGWRAAMEMFCCWPVGFLCRRCACVKAPLSCHLTNQVRQLKVSWYTVKRLFAHMAPLSAVTCLVARPQVELLINQLKANNSSVHHWPTTGITLRMLSLPDHSLSLWDSNSVFCPYLVVVFWLW